MDFQFALQIGNLLLCLVNLERGYALEKVECLIHTLQFLGMRNEAECKYRLMKFEKILQKQPESSLIYFRN